MPLFTIFTSGVFRGGPIALALPWYEETLFKGFITRKWKTCALTCQICGYFFRECVLKIALTEAFFSSKCTKYRLGAWL